ncbi:MAG TPA: leukotriene A4 hydrolase C-terminal domain-containing protein [Verrucomicrobiae bacterium]|nr:leukotriene A4 hydrolase C-terminal domain-containing protein [Verrucomicrobiae bacterium]
MSVLDDQFGFTKSSNVSIAQVWFSPRFAARYEPAYAALENLLTRVGRRRLIVSPYRDLAATPEGKVRAREIFANAREGYHPIRAFLLSAFRFSAFPLSAFRFSPLCHCLYEPSISASACAHTLSASDVSHK